MKRALNSFAVLFSVLFLSGCGGGQSVSRPPPKNQPPDFVVDPTGNWAMVAKDETGGQVNFSAVFAQSGNIVTAPFNFHEPDVSSGTFNFVLFNPVPLAPPLFQCFSNPTDTINMVFGNGLVENGNNLTASVSISDFQSGATFGVFTFNVILAPDGLSFAGTYASMPPCAGIASSGQFTGERVPSVSGTWTGMLTECSFDQVMGDCPAVNGADIGTISMLLVESDEGAIVSGDYTISLPSARLVSGHITTGWLQSWQICFGATCSNTLGPGTLSGHRLILTGQDLATMQNSYGTLVYFAIDGELGQDRSFTGLVCVAVAPNRWYRLTMTH